MDNNRGYFWVWRELFHKPIWTRSTAQQKAVLMVIMALVNYKQNEWDWNGKKFVVNPGQCVTSLKSIALLAGVSIQNVRTALVRFGNMEFLTNKSTNLGRIITITNWDSYQYQGEQANIDANKHLTGTQQAPNKHLTTNNKVKKEKKVNKEKNKDIYTRIIAHLNAKTKKQFKPSNRKTQSLINSRIKEGFTEQDFITVIDNKYAKWFTDPKMCEYLRPETLFGPKFESYLNDVPAQTKRFPEKTMRTLQNLEGWENRE